MTGKSLAAGDSVDTAQVPGETGLTIELCAGIIDKDLSEVEIAREEVKEECGYLAAVEKFTQIVKFPSSVGVSGKNFRTLRMQNLVVHTRW